MRKRAISAASMKRVSHWVFSLLVASILLILVEFFGLFQGVSSYTYDLYFRIRGPREPSDRIVVVAIDDKTLQKLGQWPISRYWYVELLNRVQGAAAVGLDIILADPSPEDAVLAQALQEMGKVVLPVYLDPERKWVRPATVLDHDFVGHIHLEPGMDGIVREVYHCITHDGIEMVSFASALHSLIDGEGRLPSSAGSSPLKAGRPREIHQDCPMMINYYGGRGAFRTVSLLDVLEGRWSASFFADRIVLVGLTAVGLDAGILTPFSNERTQLGAVEAHAHILNNLMEGTDIRLLGSWPLWLSMLLTGLITFLLIERQNPVQMLLVFLGGVVLVNVISYSALVFMRLWIPPAGFFGLMGVSCVAGYISRMRKMQSLLIQAKKDWEESFDTLDEAIILYDRDCRVARMNKAASQGLGPELLDILRSRCLYWSIPDGSRTSSPAASNSWEWTPSGDEGLDINHDGRHYEVRSLARVDADGRFHGFIHVVRDVTYRRKLEFEQKDLQNKLAHAQKMEALGTLAGGIAHDFNNILSAIIGYAELVAVSLGRESRVRERLDGIVQAAMRAKDLIQQILTFSRQNTHDRKPIQPGLIVDEAMRLLRPALPTTIEIQKNIQSRAFVEGDATQIHQIVINLCTNAYHAMKAKGGVLKVSAEDVVLHEGIEQEGWVIRPGPYVVIHVSDTGEGIPPHIRKRIFEPYFTTKEKGEGTGLGLATVHGILKSHGGGLLLESEMGKGTGFHVYLPVLEGVEPVADEGIFVGALTGTERILFVDDEAAIIDIAREALEELGYHVTARNDPSEALESFRSNAREFDIVITDLTMPKMTGVQMVMEMKKIRQDIPVILCTGYRQLVEAETIQLAGISSVVAKPAASSDIAQAIRALMDSRKGSDPVTSVRE